MPQPIAYKRLSNCIAVVLTLICGAGSVSAAEMTEEAPGHDIVVQVEATPLTLPTLPGNRLFEDIPGVTVRGQGFGMPQGDLSLRGSPFNSAGALFEGLTLRNPQTEHWHADMPLPELWFERPRLLTGLERFRTAPGHPAGSLSLKMAPLLENIRTVTLGAGSKELLFGSLLATETTSLDSDVVLAASGGLSFDRASQTDGFSDNDLTRASASTRLSAYKDEARQADLLAALSWREFGARAFYGAASEFPARERKSDALITGTVRTQDSSDNPVRVTTAWQRTQDAYWLDRHHRAFYENRHTSDSLAWHGDTRRTLSETLTLDLRADADLETIKSRTLGNHNRAHASFAALPNLTTAPLTWTAGGSLDIFSTDSPAWLPAAGVAWKVDDHNQIALNHTMSVRQPSYTELNYNSPASLGNSGLKRQRNSVTELAWEHSGQELRGRLGLFHENGHNVVDWSRNSSKARWEAIALREMQTWGLCSNADIALGRRTEIGLEALALARRTDTHAYASRYAMDYPELEGAFKLRQQLTSDLHLRLRQGCVKYARNRARRHGNWGAPADLELQWRLPWIADTTVNLGAANLHADDFQTYPGQDAPGRRFYASLTCSW